MELWLPKAVARLGAAADELDEFTNAVARFGTAADELDEFTIFLPPTCSRYMLSSLPAATAAGISGAGAAATAAWLGTSSPGGGAI